MATSAYALQLSHGEKEHVLLVVCLTKMLDCFHRSGRLIVWLVCSVTGIPLANVCTLSEYKAALARAGFEGIKAEEVPGVLSGFARFVRRHQGQYEAHLLPGIWTGLSGTAWLMESIDGHVQFVMAAGTKGPGRGRGGDPLVEGPRGAGLS